ncbi:hypothetical protein [Nocardioides pantholopis]|uniref:hypothetical protein n=1 Tax=Nocardioides pantholopis TaxID=2483798 RepID=UPI000FDBA208|nr:hypothetical protein [Nocardioides pantholopis]
MNDDASGAEPPPLSEDRRKHIDLIQTAVSRMASASATAKGWLLPVATATYGYALTKDSVSVAILGVLAVVLFGFLDSHYLRQERAFRALYRGAVRGSVPVYELNNRLYYGRANSDANDLREENCRWSKVVFSWSVTGFYGPTLLVGLVIACLNADFSSLEFCIHLG